MWHESTFSRKDNKNVEAGEKGRGLEKIEKVGGGC